MRADTAFQPKMEGQEFGEGEGNDSTTIACWKEIPGVVQASWFGAELDLIQSLVQSSSKILAQEEEMVLLLFVTSTKFLDLMLYRISPNIRTRLSIKIMRVRIQPGLLKTFYNRTTLLL